jgi:hypothetical protein
VADLSEYVSRPQPRVEALGERLSRPSARILRPVTAATPDGPHVEYELAHQVLARPALEWRQGFETARLERRSRRLLLALVALSAIALALAAYLIQPGPMRRLELDTSTLGSRSGERSRRTGTSCSSRSTIARWRA